MKVIFLLRNMINISLFLKFNLLMILCGFHNMYLAHIHLPSPCHPTSTPAQSVFQDKTRYNLKENIKRKEKSCPGSYSITHSPLVYIFLLSCIDCIELLVCFVVSVSTSSILGRELVHPIIHPICDLLELMKGLVLKTQFTRFL